MPNPPPDSGPEDRDRGKRSALAGGALWGLMSLFRWLFSPPRGYRRPLFPRGSSAAFLGALALGTLAVVAVVGVLVQRAYEPDYAGYVAPLQPVPFSHQVHAGALEIDCRYCHSSVEKAAPAGMPSTRTCVPCHNEVWLESEPFEPVRISLAENLPIAWRRVYDLADFTYFHHGAHVTSGVGCETCHGRVDRMQVIEQASSLSMGWCLDCHREPEKYLRPVDEIVTLGYAPERPQAELGPELKLLYEVSEMTHCTTCHR